MTRHSSLNSQIQVSIKLKLNLKLNLKNQILEPKNGQSKTSGLVKIRL